MKGLTKKLMCTAIASFLLAIFLLAGNVYAGSGAGTSDPTSPLQFWTGENGSYIKATIEVDYAVFDQQHSWWGNATAQIGAPSKTWQEEYNRPGIEFKYVFCGSQKFYGRFDFAQINTFDGIDAGGTNVAYGGDVDFFHREDTYVGWKSGNLFSGLQEDFLDLSFGRQRYKVDNGFLFWNEGGAGYYRAGYWMGMQTDADYAAIARIRQGGWSIDGIYLRSDDMHGVNLTQSNTRVGGVTIDYAFDKMWNIGGGVYDVESDNTFGHYAQDMMLFDIRGGVKPFAKCDLTWLQPFKLKGEFVYDDKDHHLADGIGYYAQASYQWEKCPWTPELTYRWSSFSVNYDSLFYGLSDWGYWYQGEITGEYVNGNHNLNCNLVELQVYPCKPLRVSFLYYHMTLDSTSAAGVTSGNVVDECDLVFDYTVNKHLSFSLVGADATVNTGGKELYGGSGNWMYTMFLTTVTF
jgi:hypothetical protein